MDKIVRSIKEVDMSDIYIPVIAVYENPEDYPGMCVARIFDMNRPTDTVIVRKTVKEINRDINRDIKRHKGMIKVARTKNDVPSLVCMWV